MEQQAMVPDPHVISHTLACMHACMLTGDGLPFALLLQV
jgi:hypothetical protein